jgi:superfamily I DNA/RNA helicase
MVELPLDQHHVIAGPPGSGKTQVLLHRARYIARKYHVHPDRYRVFVFTSVLSKFIKQAITLLEIPESTVQTFDHWCGDYWSSQHMGTRPQTAKGDQDYPETRRKILAHLRNRPLKEVRVLEFTVVDEGQDLDRTSYEILALIAAHVTVVADSRQQLYEGCSDLAQICGTLKIQGQSMDFLSGRRNSPSIGKLASYFGQKFEASNFEVDQETPTYRIANNWDDEIEAIAAVLRERRLMNHKCGVLVPTQRDAFSIRKKLENMGVEIEVALPRTAGTVNFDSSVPKISTYHSAKGLTFDTVLLPKLVRKNWDNFTDQFRKNMLLVGITRATQWVYLSSVQGYEMEETATLLQALKNGHLFMKDSTIKPPVTLPFDDDDKIDFG